MLRASCLATLLLFTGEAFAGELKIEVDGIRGDQGSVRVALYSDAEGFLKPEKVAAATSKPAAPGSASFIFADLAPGTYAIAGFHDENDNQELDSNLLGIPSEGIFFSEDAQANFGPPDFSDASVQITADGRTETKAVVSY